MINLSNEIKALLTIANKRQQDLQQVFNMTSRQSVANKFARNAWSVEDLAKVVNFLGGKLIIKVEDREIEITEKHFKSPD